MARTGDVSVSVLSELKKMVRTDAKMYWIVYKYAPALLPKKSANFKELQENYVCFQKLDEGHCENYIYLEDVQVAVKWLLRRVDTVRMIELYNKYYEKAKDDVQSLKVLLEFKKEFFRDEEESELYRILKDVNVDDTSEDDTEEFTMDL